MASVMAGSVTQAGRPPRDYSVVAAGAWRARQDERAERTTDRAVGVRFVHDRNAQRAGRERQWTAQVLPGELRHEERGDTQGQRVAPGATARRRALPP